MNESKPIIYEENEYDDGIVCFGPVTESQLERIRRLPRHTLIPSDTQLSQSILDINEAEEDNDQSTFFNASLDESIQNDTIHNENSIDVTHKTNGFYEKEKETAPIQLKQSCINGSPSVFSSPCVTKSVPIKLVDTEILNRYIRMGSISSDESISDNQTSLYEGDLDVQESELFENKTINNETNTCEELSNLSSIEQKQCNNQDEMPNVANNICKLQYRNQEEHDLLMISSCSTSDFGDIDDSIVSDEYIVTPGKKRLFDLRFVKKSFQSKMLKTSVPIMDRIEETTTPNQFNSSLTDLSDVNSIILPEKGKNVDTSLIANKSSILNQTSCEWEIESGNNVNDSEQTIDVNLMEYDNVKEILTSDNFRSTLSGNCMDYLNKTGKCVDLKIVNVNGNGIDILNSTALTTEGEKPETMEVDTYSTNTSIVDDTTYIEKHSTSKLSMNFNESINNSYDTEYNFNEEKSINNISNTNIPTNHVYELKTEEKLALEMETITTVAENKFADSSCIEKVSTSNKTMNFNESINNSYGTECNFDEEKSVNSISNLTIPKNHINKLKSDERSIVEMKTITTIDNTFDDTTCIEKHSTSKLSMNFNESMNNSYGTEYNFNEEKSVNSISNTNIPTNHINKLKSDERSNVEMETITTTLDNTFDDTTCIEKHSTSKLSMNFNESINNSYDTEYNFIEEKSINNISNTSIPTNHVNELKSEEKLALEMETITTVVENKFADSSFIEKVSTSNRTMNFNESINNSYGTEYNFDEEKSVNSISNLTIPKNHINKLKSDKKSIVEMKTITTTLDKTFDDTTCIEKLSTSKINMNFNESINTSYGTESNFNEEKSVINISSTTIPNNHVNELKSDKSALVVETNFTNTNVDNIFDNTSCTTSPLSIQNNGKYIIDLNESFNKNSELINNSNVSECKFENVEKINLNNSTEPSVTINQTLEIPSHAMKKYLDFEQTINKMCTGNILSNSCNTELIESSQNNQIQENISMIEQTKCSESFNSINEDESFSIFNNLMTSNLSVIIENRTLEENSSDLVVPNKDVNNSKNLSTTSVSENLNKNQTTQMLQLTSQNDKECIEDFASNLKVVNVSLTNEKILIDNNINSELQLVENKINEEKINETQLNDSYFTLYDGLLKTESNTSINGKNPNDYNATDQSHISKYVDELILNQSNYGKINLININDSTAVNHVQISEDNQNFTGQEHELLNDNEQLDLLNAIGNKNLEEYIQTDEIFNIEDYEKVQTFNSKTSKPKIFDFSIVQQTPISKTEQKTSVIGNFVKRDNLIVFSPVKQICDLKGKSSNETMFNKDLENSLSTISAPDIESLIDDPTEINSSNNSNESLNQTITGTNLVQSAYTFEMNNESKGNNVNKQYVEKDQIEKMNSVSKCSSDTIINQCTNLKDLNQQLILNLNEHANVESLVLEQPILKISELRNKENVTSVVESDSNISNFNEKSISITKDVIKLSKDLPISSENPQTVVTTNNKFEKSINQSSDAYNNINVNLEENTFLHNTEFLTDIQMNDISLMELSGKSSISESFHSIELDHTQEDNKRKMEPVQEYLNKEKKIKVNVEEPKTPISMLYKIRNMFKSNEKPSYSASNTKENDLRSDKCYQSLNFSILEENKGNFTKPKSSHKSEVSVKSKIPCKVTDRLITKHDESNNSLLNDSIKPKKTIPKFIGTPVLSDLSNSSNKKYLESRIPSKLKK